MKIETLALMQIVLIMGMTFSNLYFIDQTNPQLYSQESLLSKIIKFITILPSVSAIEGIDYEQGVQTCLKTKTGQFCQQMLYSECETKCDGACVPATASNIPECKPGTCYSAKQGTCQIGSSKLACENSGGQWNSDPNGNIPQCKPGCCILGSQTAFVGSRECSVMSEQLGVAKSFKSEITTEIACLALSGGDVQGACVYEEDFENTCRFTTKSACLQINGDFNAGYLCSAAELQTNCRKQATARCVDGKDEIYWFDSCGNQENIYSANKEQSWNNGKVLSKSASCDITNNAATCGNCNYLLGTRCGAKTSTTKLADNSINSVCRPLTCVDENGEQRKNGESWCSFNSQIGVDQGRSADVAGSRHFRQVCIDGEVRTEPCQDFRNGICVENNVEEVEGGFSSAACRTNTWQQCINYNFQNQTDQCTKNSDCFLNNVKVSESFNYNVCVPKYNPGFDIVTKPESAEMVCSVGSQKCTVTYVKGLSGWKCKQNCECLEKKFGEQMNNLCMSLGDCGTKVNIAGKVSENSKISNSPKLDAAYIAGITKYKDPVKGQRAEPGTSALFSGTLGIPNELNGQPIEGSQAAIDAASTIGGGLGTALLVSGWIAAKVLTASSSVGVSSLFFGIAKSTGIGLTTTTSTTASGVGITTSSLGGGGVISGSANGATLTYSTVNPGIAAFGGALVGAATGLAITALLLKISGVGAGLPSGLTYALLAAGTTAGIIFFGAKAAAATGTTATSGGLGGFFVSNAAWAGYLAIFVLAVIVVLKILGVGKTKQTVVEFNCQPWQAPTGGADCSLCGKDGLPCSKYACQSLGQTCQLINENEPEQTCVSISRDDVSAPIISSMKETLSEDLKITSETSEGFTLKGKEDCLPAYTNIEFGIKLNEPAQCRYDVLHTSRYEDMEFSFGGRNLYLENHTMAMSIPSLESLGLIDVTDETKMDLNLLVRCQDKNGNKNIREYSINLCVSQGLDIVPPVMLKVSPQSNYVGYSATEVELGVATNEPADCKFDVADANYDGMQNSMTCLNNATDYTGFGFICTSKVPFVGNESKYYVKCLDQPWLNETDIENGKTRNANKQSLVIDVKRTINPLKIDSLSPNNVTITSNVKPATVELNARTSGGIDGTAICSLNISGNWITFMNTGQRTHSWSLNQMSAGNKTAQVRCIDDAGNIAEKTSQFSVVIDQNIPTITRVYGKQNTLYVVTDEKSECKFSNTACDFDYDLGTVMSGIDKVHTTTLNNKKDYFISCKDRLGNKAGQCTIVVRKGAFDNA